VAVHPFFSFELQFGNGNVAVGAGKFQVRFFIGNKCAGWFRGLACFFLGKKTFSFLPCSSVNAAG
jgi:hypothetical protein